MPFIADSATPAPKFSSDLERARAALRDEDPARAKLILYPILSGKKTSNDELRVLREACAKSNDPLCVAECDKRFNANL